MTRAPSVVHSGSSVGPARARLLSALLTPGRTRVIGHGLVLMGLGFGALIFASLLLAVQSYGYDAYAYWLVDLAAPYDIPHRTVGSFPYSPPAAMVASTFSALPWWVFLWLWTALLVASLIWIGGTGGWIIAAFAIPAIALELYHGNIHILIAVAVVLGFRHPWTWSFVLLTKFTAGIGLLWFAVRRDWRSLGIALGSTAALCALSWLVAPGLWAEWVAYLNDATAGGSSPNTIAIPLELRLPVAALVVAWGARTDRRWTVIVAVALSLPVIWFHGLAVLVGLFGEIEHRKGTPASLAVKGMKRRFRVTSIDAPA